MGSLWNRSGTVERFADDLRAAGAKAYFYQGGTTTPYTVYRDAAQGSAFPFPLLADANGRWPDVFVPFTTGSYDVRVTSAGDVQLTFSQFIPNPNPVDVTVTVPSDQTVQTGMIHAEMVNTTKSGYVRLNGNTISNGVNSATERGNPDCLALFTYLWNNLDNTIAPVSGGRGGSAAADFSPGNKVMTLPDWRGYCPRGLDDMGSSGGAANAFAGLAFTLGTNIKAGSKIGVNSMTLSTANMPAHIHTGSTGLAGSHTHTTSINVGQNTSDVSIDHRHDYTGTGSGQASLDGAGTPDGGHTHTVRTGVTPIGAATGLAMNANSETSAMSVTGDGSHIHNVFVNVSGTTGFTKPDANATLHHHSLSGVLGVTGIPIDSVTTAANHTHGISIDPAGSGTSFTNLGLTTLVTWFIKL